jgi:N-acetylglucosamine kinase-like BadF-type ATPase
VTAGTGVVMLAVGADGRPHRVDGHGPLLGDRGSGYAIGLAGLRTAMRVLDGLDGSTMLADELRQEYGTADEAVHTIHASSTPTRLVASFSRNVATAAKRGDSVAVAMWNDAGVELARGAAAVARTAGLAGDEYTVAYSGGLFGAGLLLLDPLGAELARISPAATLMPAEGDAVAGGATMAVSPQPLLGGVSSWLVGRG